MSVSLDCTELDCWESDVSAVPSVAGEAVLGWTVVDCGQTWEDADDTTDFQCADVYCELFPIIEGCD